MSDRVKDILQSEERPELVIGLAGPIGSDFSTITEIISSELKRVDYNSIPIRISQLLKDFDDSIPEEKYVDERYKTLMAAGTRFRENSKDGRILAFLACLKIQNERKEITGDVIKPASKTAFVIRSFKHPDEVHALRKIYGKAFFLIGVNTSRDLRKRTLTREIEKSRYGVDTNFAGSKAEELIERDEEEVGAKLGQQLRDTFAYSDVFVDGDNLDSAKKEIQRFVGLLFGNPFITPSKEEYAMSLCFNAALRSSDLSRQVGAIITDDEGSILASGCNEVPKANGGAYWPTDKDDYRDFKLGSDPSHTSKIEMLKEILFRLKQEGWISDAKKEDEIDDLIKKALFENDPETGKAPFMKGAKLMDLLEFGRVVHAEMHAISDAARRGISSQGNTLFCTTYPCHNCARHIISTGIKKVIYIEPYPKSMTAELYDDSVSISEADANTKVVFKPFTGVAPSRFFELFSMAKRKDKVTGKALSWNPLTANPKCEINYWRMRTLEPAILALVEKTLLPRITDSTIPNKDLMEGKNG